MHSNSGHQYFSILRVTLIYLYQSYNISRWEKNLHNTIGMGNDSVTSGDVLNQIQNNHNENFLKCTDPHTYDKATLS